MCEWSTTGDNGRSNEQGDNDQWLLDLWFHYNAVEEGISDWIYYNFFNDLIVLLVIWKFEQYIIICVQRIIYTYMDGVHSTELDRVCFKGSYT